MNLDYDLPEDRIAQSPLADRAASKLLWLHRDSGRIEDRAFREVVQILQPGDLLVVNDTRVTAKRLLGQKASGGRVEALLLRDLGEGRFEALVRPAKRLRVGTPIFFDEIRATVEVELPEGRRELRFETEPALERFGEVPLPPYIHARLADPERYQTVYGKRAGSAAAPTAGLHFTPAILADLQAGGVNVASVTLDVGLDTFRPISGEPEGHEMHGETCEVPPETAEAIERAKGRIVAVGTTTVRTLESLATGRRQVEPGRRETRLFITPGFPFQVVDGMFTNFHMPRTTMLLMIGAMAGPEAIHSAYLHALASEYRFLSFGDSMLIL